MVEVFDITGIRRTSAFFEALGAAAKGDKIIYHRGENVRGAHKSPALAAAAQGRVALVQKRLGPHQFEYTAQVIEGGAV